MKYLKITDVWDMLELYDIQKDECPEEIPLDKDGSVLCTYDGCDKCWGIALAEKSIEIRGNIKNQVS